MPVNKQDKRGEMAKEVITRKKQKRKKCKAPGLIVTFDDKEYSQDETAFLWTRLIKTLFKLEKDKKQV